jgi:hypothetical protein
VNVMAVITIPVIIHAELLSIQVIY